MTKNVRDQYNFDENVLDQFFSRDFKSLWTVCALKIFFDFFYRQNRKRETRENGLSHLSRLAFFVARCFLPGELLEEGSTSSTTGVSDDLASVEREEHRA